VTAPAEQKYARIERERRFLLKEFPTGANVVRSLHIVDRYIHDTTLRLREQKASDGTPVFKLTQKIAQPGEGAQQGIVTTIYLNQDEFCILKQLPALTLSKVRYSVPPFGIDVFEGALEGLVLAEAEFDSTVAAEALEIPPFAIREVSEDIRFTGGRLVRASPDELRAWLAEYGMPAARSSAGT